MARNAVIAIHMKDTYRTLAAPAEGIYKEKGSRFLAFAAPVQTDDDIKTALSDLRKTYFDARHHCYAYLLGFDQIRHRADDDGEPTHSAGDPILGQLRSRHLTDALVVVVRYFGGVKLGVGGLIHAYRMAAACALDAAPTVEKMVMVPFTIRFSYEQMSGVMRLLKEAEAGIDKQDFQAECRLTASVRRGQHAALLEKLRRFRVEAV